MRAPLELPVIGSEPIERADAARNRERVLCAAQKLFAERGASCVSMDEVAELAGVGKGTLFRRFGSRAALAQAVLSERDRAFQEKLIRGAPPLGPGTDPRERLIAFGSALIDMLDENIELLLAAEGAGAARFASGPYGAYRLHMRLLLEQADPGCDADYLSAILLAALGGGLFLHLRDDRGFDRRRMKDGWRELVARLTGAGASPAAAGPRA